ncbi:MAG: hypothetical protein O9284_16280 [Steroidobacteraceae bacterium]|nr:hypothetical protein [Steroidobacteraceae bacterium]
MLTALSWSEAAALGVEVMGIALLGEFAPARRHVAQRVVDQVVEARCASRPLIAATSGFSCACRGFN